MVGKGGGVRWSRAASVATGACLTPHLPQPRPSCDVWLDILALHFVIDSRPQLTQTYFYIANAH